jgi:hypothetical protein
MSQDSDQPAGASTDPPDPALERILGDRKPGEIETGMMSGSDAGEISATDRFEGEVTREEALAVLAPEGGSGETGK